MPVCHFSNTRLSTTQLSLLYHSLLSNGLIGDSCSEEDFIFYFSGKGVTPTAPINWIGTKTLLALYLDEIRDKSKKCEWKYVDYIFCNCKGKTIERVLRSPFSNDCSRSFDTFFENRKKVQEMIESIMSQG